MKHNESFRRDNLLVGFLREHKGPNNAVSTVDIKKYLADRGYPTSRDNIRQRIHKLVFERSLPICSLSSKGYFWASCLDDIAQTIKEFQSRINELQARIDVLKSFIVI